MNSYETIRPSYQGGYEGAVRNGRRQVIATCGHWHRTKMSAEQCGVALYREMGGEFAPLFPGSPINAPTNRRPILQETR